MTRMPLRVFALVLVGLGVPWLTAAQAPVQLKSVGATGTIATNGASVTLEGVGGLASLGIQVTGSYSGTWAVQCASDAAMANYDTTGDEVLITRNGASATAVASVSDLVGIWQGNITPCKAIRVIATAWSGGTATFQLLAITPGGGSSGGGSGGGGGAITSVVPGTGATNSGKAEDTAHTTGDTGEMPLAVRRDADTTLADATGDYAPLQVNASGSLKVAITSGAGSGGTALADNAGFTPSTTSFTPVGGEVDDTGTTAVTENSAGVARMTVQRALHVNLRNAAGTELTPSVDVTEDAAETAGGTGPMVLNVRRDTPVTSAGGTGENATFNSGPEGGLYVSPVATAGNGAGANGCAVLSTASTNATNCKNTSGNVYGMYLLNTTTTVYYLRIYNSSAAPTCSSATGFVQSWPVPPAGAAGGTGGFSFDFTVGRAYGTGISYCLTGGSTSTDNTNAAAGIFGEILYK